MYMADLVHDDTLMSGKCPSSCISYRLYEEFVITRTLNYVTIDRLVKVCDGSACTWSAL